MERYNIVKEVGNGTFGSVWQAFSKQNGDVVAIKKMKKKYYTWEECVSLREVKSLRRMNHPNIVKLKEVIRENDVLYFVFEYMECNLYQLIEDKGKRFSEVEVRNMCFQVFQGLAYVHQRGYFHRDLKPENLLVSDGVIKIADFGLAREINSQPPFTDYVSTRWYRAPEVLLQSPTYGPPVDMWAMGAIMAELLTLRPLFPGSSEVDEMYKICNVIGCPTKNEWSEGLELADAIGYQFPQVAGVHLSLLVPHVSEDAIDLIASLCSWNPCKRPTALEALRHPFFQSCSYIPPPMRHKVPVARAACAGTRGATDRELGLKYPVHSYPKTMNRYYSSKLQPSLNPGVQRKLDMNNQESASKIDKNLNIYAKQQKYWPHGANETAGRMGIIKHEVSETTEKLEKMKMGCGRPLAMMSGGWHLAQSTTARGTYTRNVA